MAPPPADGVPDRLVLALLDEAKDLLRAVGVRLSVVSVDEIRAVVIIEPANGRVSVPKACDLSRRVLARVAAAARGAPTDLVELRCGRDAEWPCTFSLEWGPVPGPPPVDETDDVGVVEPVPEPLLEPPIEPSLEMLIGAERHRPSPSADAAPPPSPGRQSDEIDRSSRRNGLTLPPWFARRWWVLALCILAGAAGGAVAHSSQTPRYNGLPLGALVGLLIGLVIVVGIERADPRADDVADLAHATGTAATAYPGPISLADLALLLDRASDGVADVTLVPLSGREVSQVIALHHGLVEAADVPSTAFGLAGPVGWLDEGLIRGEGPTVLVVRTSARLRSVRESVRRLELLGRRPVWAVLAVGQDLLGSRR